MDEFQAVKKQKRQEALPRTLYRDFTKVAEDYLKLYPVDRFLKKKEELNSPLIDSMLGVGRVYWMSVLLAWLRKELSVAEFNKCHFYALLKFITEYTITRHKKIVSVNEDKMRANKIRKLPEQYVHDFINYLRGE